MPPILPASLDPRTAPAGHFARIASHLRDAVCVVLTVTCLLLFGASLFAMLHPADMPDAVPLAANVAASAGQSLRSQAASMQHHSSALLADLYLLRSVRNGGELRGALSAGARSLRGLAGSAGSSARSEQSAAASQDHGAAQAAGRTVQAALRAASAQDSAEAL